MLPWRAALESETRRYFGEDGDQRTRVSLPDDADEFVIRVLHRVFFGLDEAALEEFLGGEDGYRDFLRMQRGTWLFVMLPNWLLSCRLLRWLLPRSLKEVPEARARWLRKYEERVRGGGGPGGVTDRPDTLAMAVMDAMNFAGGLSVRTAITRSLALPFSPWGHANLPGSLDLCDSASHRPYIYEVLRRWPLVEAVSYTRHADAACGGSRPEFLNLHMAQRDPAVWGETPEHFEVRPLETYEKLSVSFAEDRGPAAGKPHSHECPAKALALAIIETFTRGVFCAPSCAKAGGFRAVWRAERAPKKVVSQGQGPTAKVAPSSTTYGQTAALLPDLGVFGPASGKKKFDLVRISREGSCRQ